MRRWAIRTLLLFVVSCSAQVITTAAGTTWIFRANGSPAVNAPLGKLWGTAFDTAGNLYVSDEDNNVVLRIATSGTVAVAAGNGIRGFSGDGGTATSASLNKPYGLAVDSDQNLYIAEYGNNRVRKVTAAGIISTVAGDGFQNSSGLGRYTGDGGPATAASLSLPSDVAVDQGGNLYIADTFNSSIRKVTPDGIITTVAGTGNGGGFGTPAAGVTLATPAGVSVDASGNVFIADTGHNLIRKLTPAGVATIVAGSGTSGFGGDGGPATGATLTFPGRAIVDGAGNLYISDTTNNRIRRVGTNGIISTICGVGPTGTFAGGFSGDGGPATQASINTPEGLAVDSSGNLYFADNQNLRIRKIDSGGNITTVAGSGSFKFFGDGGTATGANLHQPSSVAVDAAGDFYIADTLNRRVRKVTPDGRIVTVAGNGSATFSGDGAVATTAGLGNPMGVAVDQSGNLFIASAGRVRKVSSTGIISTLAGPIVRFAGGFPSVFSGLSADNAGNLYVAESGSRVILRVNAAGNVTIVAGSLGLPPGFSGDGGPATQAALSYASAVAVDAAGNLFIADTENHRIRKVNGSGIISTVAGNGNAAFSGDGGPAITASLNQPDGISVDRGGNLYIADTANQRVRMVNVNGTITTIAGNGAAGFSGDGGVATAASLNMIAPLSQESGVAADASGNVFIVDGSNDRIRKIQSAPPSFMLGVTSLSFSAAAGATAVATQQIPIVSSLPGLSLNVAASTQSGGNWLAASPSSLAAPGAVTVSVNAATLQAGSYQGTVTVTSAVGGQQSVAISLTVTAAPPARLAVTPPSLTFQAAVGGGNPTLQAIQIANAGGGTLNWSAQSNAPWLTIASATGSAASGSPATVSVSVSIAGLSAIVYSGSIAIQSATTGETKTIPVTLLISQSATILLSQTGVRFTGVEGSAAVPSQTIAVLNIGQGPGQGSMDWTAQASAGGWLAVTSSGTSVSGASVGAPLEIRVDVMGLRAGLYNGTVQVASSAATNSPQVIVVVLNVLAQGSTPPAVVRPSGLLFVRQAGTSSPGSQTITIASASSALQEATAFPSTESGGAWLEALPRDLNFSSAAPGTVVVQPSLGSLAPGQYRGSVSLGFSDGSSQQVSVLFVVTPAGGSGATVQAEIQRPPAAGACTPTQLFLVYQGDKGPFPVSWPSDLQVQVMDDCGNAVSNASVQAGFSNGDPALSLISVGNGIYGGVWQPDGSQPQVLLNFTAKLSGLSDASAPITIALVGNPAVSFPAIYAGGVVQAASYAQDNVIAPGSLVSIFGVNLAQGANYATLPLPILLGSTSVTIGGLNAPLLYSGSGQINLQAPFALPPDTRQQVMVTVRNADGTQSVSKPEPVSIAQGKPGIFTLNQNGAGQGAVFKGATVADSNSPAQAGDVVTVYCTGLGATQPAVPDGAPTPAGALYNAVLTPTAMVGGVPAQVQFAGLTSGFVGLYQVNLAIPAGVSPGTAVGLTISQNGMTSNTVILAIH